MKPMKALEALEHAMMFAMLRDTLPKRPGAAIERLDATTREALTRLTSDEALRARPDWIKKT